MKLTIKYATIDKLPRMEAPYYNFFCALNGETLTSGLIRRMFAKNKNPKEIVKFFDPNYFDTLVAIRDAYFEKENISMIDILDEDGNTIAYGRINWALADNENNASVIDVAIAMPMGKKVAEDFYSSFIDAVEEFITIRNENINLVTHEIPTNNSAYLDSMFEKKDYNMEPYPEEYQKTILYEKWVRNRPKVREARTPQK